ncbi:hypothetical protein LEADMM068B1_18440 [Leclercia adecarboxylata]|uniref:hypothetical protein n=1 Tax=Leclercia adecarboxylata TaxID=83655 RepID=UPI003B2566B2
MSSRDEFEAWWEINYHNGKPPRFGWAAWRDGDGYKIDDDESELDGMWNAWQAATNALEAKCAALAAENAALNEKMNKLATWPGIEFYSSAWEFNNGDGNAALEFMCDVQTPATDDFLAEVRAQGVDVAISELNQLAERSEKEAPIAAEHHCSAAMYLQLFAAQLRQEAAR